MQKETSAAGDSTARQGTARLGIITPVFNEEANLKRYVETVADVLFTAPDLDVRILLVDDGSVDGSWRLIGELIAHDARFSGLRLSRNYGSHLAIAAGFDHMADDIDAVAILACDLQDPAEVVLQFVEQWRKGADIVWGKRRTRDDEGWRRRASAMLEKLLRWFAMPKHSRFTTGSFLLMDRQVLHCLLQFREQNRVTFALVAWTGFEQAVVEYDRKRRIAGVSGWGFGRMLNTAYDVFIGFSPVPAKMMTGLGIGMFGLSLAALVYLMATWAFSRVLPGWTGVMVTMTTCFGLLFMMMGMTAEYLYRIFVETKNRPLYFVSGRRGDMAKHTQIN